MSLSAAGVSASTFGSWSSLILSFFAEKLQAIASPWAEFVNEVDMKYISISGGLASHVDFDTKRGRTFQNLSSMLYCCEEVDLRRTPSAIQLEKWLNEPTGPSQTFKSRVERMLSNMLEIACDTTLNRGFTGFSAKVSPAEFVFIGMCLCLQSSKVNFMIFMRRRPSLHDA
jgi:hypothetical protein